MAKRTADILKKLKIKITISLQRFKLSEQNMAVWRTCWFWSSSADEILNVIKFNNPDGCNFKINIIQYLTSDLRYLHQICQRHAKCHLNKAKAVRKLLQVKSNMADDRCPEFKNVISSHTHTSDGSKEACVRLKDAHWRNLVYTTERFMCGGDAAIFIKLLWQLVIITVTITAAVIVIFYMIWWNYFVYLVFIIFSVKSCNISTVICIFYHWLFVVY